MAIKIQVRRGTETEWSTSNPVLSSGEFGYNTTNKQYKIGDGSTAWNSLSYSGDGSGTGAQGIQGLQGYTGTTGVQGAVGATGAQGTTGATGNDGAQGAVGPAGAQGTTGTTGATGLQGANGNDGAQGATGLQGANGNDGAQGATGLQGANGNDGAQGATGLQGPAGIQGETGTQGVQGPAGSYTTSAELAADISDETGTGSVVFSTGPTVSNLIITGTLTADGSAGTSGQVLTSTVNGTRWSDSTGGTPSFHPFAMIG